MLSNRALYHYCPTDLFTSTVQQSLLSLLSFLLLPSNRALYHYCPTELCIITVQQRFYHYCPTELLSLLSFLSALSNRAFLSNRALYQYCPTELLSLLSFLSILSNRALLPNRAFFIITELFISFYQYCPTELFIITELFISTVLQSFFYQYCPTELFISAVQQSYYQCCPTELFISTVQRSFLSLLSNRAGSCSVLSTVSPWWPRPQCVTKDRPVSRPTPWRCRAIRRPGRPSASSPCRVKWSTSTLPFNSW